MRRRRRTLALVAAAAGIVGGGALGWACRADAASVPPARPSALTFKKLSVVAGAPGGPGHRDGWRTDARFSEPVALAFDGAHHLFVADHDDTLRKIDLASGDVTTLAGTPGVIGDSDGAGAGATFYEPSGLACDGAGNVYVSDTRNDTIRKIVVATGKVTTLAGAPGEAGHDDGVGSRARFDAPMGLASDGRGHLFVADSGNNAIRRVDLATGAVTSLAGSPGAPPEGRSNPLMELLVSPGGVSAKPGGLGRSDGRGAAARFHAPVGLAFDRSGVLYVAEDGSGTIRKVVVATGEVTTLAGSAGSGVSADGTGREADFAGPFALALNRTGGLIVAQAGDNALREIDLKTGEVTTFAGSSKLFGEARGVAVDDTGNLYVADAGQSVIRRVVIGNAAAPRLSEAAEPLWHGDLNEGWRRFRHLRLHPPLGEFSTYAGAPPKKGNVDGIGRAARFDTPGALAFDGKDALYVVDRGNKVVRKVALGTRAVTSVSATTGYVSGAESLAADRPGRFFLTDSADDVVLSVDVARDEATTLVGGSWIGSEEHWPVEMALDGAGGLVVPDERGAQLRRVAIDSGEDELVRGFPYSYPPPPPGTVPEPFGSDGWPAYVSGLATDGAGNAFVADKRSGTVEKLVLATGTVTTLAGSPGLLGHHDGVGPAARFEAPSVLAYDGAGGLFVGDDATVRRVDVATGRVVTVVGVPGQHGVSPGSLPAGLNHVGGLAVGADGALYVSDDAENVVLEVR